MSGTNEEYFPVEYWDDRALRVVFNKIDRRRYRKLWEEGKLKFQREGKERPAHYPDPESFQ